VIPSIKIEAPPELEVVRTRLASFDVGNLTEIERLIGVAGAESDIHVELAPESSAAARGTPQWISGFAVAASSTVVIFPARTPGYPNTTLEDVYRHEIAHVLIWRAAGGRRVPRWFDEGLAMATERERRFQDQTQLFYQLLGSSHTTLDELDHLFSRGQNDQVRAYALAGAIVDDVFQRYGPTACRNILMRMHDGEDFDRSFKAVTGLTPESLDAEFWRRQRIWTIWVPILGSSTTLWLVITFLALLAIYMRRKRNQKIEEEWAKEDPEN
jgi:hypothetical protein